MAWFRHGQLVQPVFLPAYGVALLRQFLGDWFFLAAYSLELHPLLHAGHDVYCISAVTSAAFIYLIPYPFVPAVTRDHV